MKRPNYVSLFCMLMLVIVAAEGAAESTSDSILAAVDRFARGEDAGVVKVGATKLHPFGGKPPILGCAPLRLCSVVLEAGEIVTGIHAGDSGRWESLESHTGEGDRAAPVISFKPVMEVDRVCEGLSTNVLIPTSRRIYRLFLNVPRCSWDIPAGEVPEMEYDSLVRFYYPDDILDERNALLEERIAALRARAAVDATVAATSAQSTDDLNFRYRFKSRRSFPWRPTVFDDGARTFIRLPGVARVVPGVFTRRSKALGVVNFKMSNEDDQLLIVEGLHKELVLTLPRGGRKPRELAIHREDRDG